MSTFNIGSVQGGNVAAGDGAEIKGDGRLEVTAPAADAGVVAALEMLRARLDELAAALERHRNEAPEGLAEEVAQARAEAGQDEPDPGRLRVLTGRVVQGAKGVTALGAAAASIEAAFGQLPF